MTLDRKIRFRSVDFDTDQFEIVTVEPERAVMIAVPDDLQGRSDFCRILNRDRSRGSPWGLASPAGDNLLDEWRCVLAKAALRARFSHRRWWCSDLP